MQLDLRFSTSLYACTEKLCIANCVQSNYDVTLWLPKVFSHNRSQCFPSKWVGITARKIHLLISIRTPQEGGIHNNFDLINWKEFYGLHYEGWLGGFVEVDKIILLKKLRFPSYIK